MQMQKGAKQMLHIQYQGRNLMEQICTVEVAVDEQKRHIHIFDPQQVVWPEYNGVLKQYILSESFYTMLAVLRRKYLFQQDCFKTESDWLNLIDWYFYIPNKKVLKYANGAVTIVPAENTLLYDKYLSRI